MESMNLEEKLVELEFINGELIAEYNEIDQVLRAVGFPQGMASLKDVAGDLMRQAIIESQHDNML